MNLRMNIILSNEAIGNIITIINLFVEWFVGDRSDDGFYISNETNNNSNSQPKKQYS
jgi:hypothetical protein